MSVSLEMHRGLAETFIIDVRHNNIDFDLDGYSVIMCIGTVLDGAAAHEVDGSVESTGDVIFTIDKDTSALLTADKYFVTIKIYQESDASDIEPVDWGLLYVLSTVLEEES